MLMSGDSEISIGELARQLEGVVARLEAIMKRLDSGQFVRSDLFERYESHVTGKLADIEKDVDNKAEKHDVDNLKTRMTKLEDDKTWVTRLVVSFIILAVLGVVFTTTGIQT